STASATIKNAETAPEGVVFFLINGLPSRKLRLHSWATGKQKRAVMLIKVGVLAKPAGITVRTFHHK
ncbi:hypothetical protein, partial [Enterobacter asburiae]